MTHFVLRLKIYRDVSPADETLQPPGDECFFHQARLIILMHCGKPTCKLNPRPPRGLLLTQKSELTFQVSYLLAIVILLMHHYLLIYL